MTGVGKNRQARKTAQPTKKITPNDEPDLQGLFHEELSENEIAVQHIGF